MLRTILSGEARQAAMYTATAALSRFGALLLVPIFWNRLSPADYGAIALTELTNTLVGSYLGLQLETGLSRMYYEWPESERRRRLGAVWMAHWGSSLGLGLVSVPLIAIATPLLFPNVDFYPAVFFGVVYAVIGRMKALVVAALRIKRLLWTFALLQLGGFAVYVALELYFVLVLDMGLIGYLYALILSELIGLVASGIIMLVHSTPCLRNAGLREVIRYSLPLVPNSMLGTASSILDTFVLQHVASLEVLGIYSVSSKFVGLVPTLQDALKMSFAPFLFQAASERGKEAPALIASVRMFYLVPMLIAAGCISVLIEDFVRIIDRPEYFDVIYYVPLLMGPAVLDSLNVYFTSGLLLAKRTDLMWVPTMARLVAIVITGLALIPPFEIGGLIVSRYVTVVVNLGVAFYLSQRHYFVPVQWTRMAILGASFAVVSALAALYSIDPLWLDILINCLLCAAFSLLAIIVVLARREPVPAR